MTDLTTTDLVAPSDTTPGFCRSCCAARDLLRPGTVLRAGLCCHVTDEPECLECGGTDVDECSADEADRREYQADQASLALAIFATALDFWRQGMAHQGGMMLGGLVNAIRVHSPEECELHENYTAAMAVRDVEDAAQ